MFLAVFCVCLINAEMLDFPDYDVNQKRYVSYAYDYGGFNMEYLNQISEERKHYDAISDKVDNTVKDLKVEPIGSTEEVNGQEEFTCSSILAIFNIECYPDVKSHNFWLKIEKLLIIWALVYLVVLVPCWCQYGWCCCCFRCDFCRPQKRIRDLKQFILQNPPGKLYTTEYRAQPYEIYLYNSLKNKLFRMV